MTLKESLKNGAPLSALAEFPQFLHWTVKQDARTGRDYKVTVCPVTGRNINAHDPANWMTAEHAILINETSPHTRGVGFAFTENDPFVFVDIDKCVTDAGEWSPVATDLMGALAGGAVELSQSGKGLHIFGKWSPLEHSCKNGAYGVECYHNERFVALTGNVLAGDAGVDLSAPMADVVARYFQPTVNARDVNWTDGPTHPDWCGPEDDDELIKIACKSVSAGAAFGAAISFRDLWEANTDALALHYPDVYGAGRDWDASSVDAALVMHLAFWTGGDHERIKRLMLRTPHVRDKWDRIEGYLEPTIAGGVAKQGAAYSNPKYKPVEESPEMQAILATQTTAAAAPVIDATAEPAPELDGVITSNNFMPVLDQITHFKGCCYVRSLHQIFTPCGETMDQGRFRATYGGFNFCMDGTNQKTTKSAWEAFTESQGYVFPKVARPRFKPQEPSGEIKDDSVNVYVDPKVACKPGDVTPFLNHVKKLLPNEEDQTIFLSYISGIVQNQGEKAPWTVLLQGAEGNGKTILTMAVEEAIGLQYCHRPNADDIGNKFNGWLADKIFIGVEDIYVNEKRRDVIEILKPMVTGTRQEVQPKGVDKITVDICANFLFNSNHKDAIRKTRNDRRFCVLFCAQQNEEDIYRDGLGGDYFPRLLHWLRECDGFAHVTNYLKTFVIPEKYDFTRAAVRAPISSSTEAAIAASLGTVEQEILEAVEEGRIGFRGGWISSIHLTNLLESKRLAARVPKNKRTGVLKELGYIPHPELRNGRVDNPINCDGGKPRLYIHREAIIDGETRKEVAQRYENAQISEIFT